MKKIRFDYAGGMPLDSEDFEFLLPSIYNALGNIGIGLAGNHAEPDISAFSPVENGVFVVLRGGTLSYVGSSVTGTISWTKGWALWKGELREIRPGSVAVTWASITGLLWAEAVEVSGTETYEDGPVYDTYRDEYLTIVASTSPVGPGVIKAWTNTLSTGTATPYYLADRLAEQVYSKLKNYVVAKAQAWTAVTPGANWAPSALGNGLSYRINMDGTATVAGIVQLIGSPGSLIGAALIIATGLPKLQGYNSLSIEALFCPVNAWEGATGTPVRACNVRIDTNGDLLYYGVDTAPPVLLLPINFTYPYNPLI